MAKGQEGERAADAREDGEGEPEGSEGAAGEVKGASEDGAEGAQVAPVAKRAAADAPAEALRLPRWSLVVSSALHGALFGWGAWVLPWRTWSAIGAALALVAALHGATMVLAALQARPLAWVWRAQGLASLGLLAYVGWGMGTSAWYLRGLYSGLGDGLAAAIAAVVGLVAAVTLPNALWAIASTGGVRMSAGRGAAIAAVAALVSVQLASIHAEASGTALADAAQVEASAEALRGALASAEPERVRRRAGSLMTDAPVTCDAPITAERLSAVLTFAYSDGGPVAKVTTACVQAASPQALGDAVAALLKERRVTRNFIKADLIVRRGEIPENLGLLQSLALQPGLDGVCLGARCLMPWQLVAADAFVVHTPVPSIPDLRFGASFPDLAARLDPKGDPAALARIETVSLLRTRGEAVHTLTRPPNVPLEVSPTEVKAAAQAAQRYIERAQLRQGNFTYILNPFSGAREDGPFSVARQAGTTLALCELGLDKGGKVPATVVKSLDYLAALEQQVTRSTTKAQMGVIRAPGSGRNTDRIGGSALTLAALLRCRPMVGQRYDALIGRLMRLMLNAQRKDGSFLHKFNTNTGAVSRKSRGKLYIDGQVVLSMVLFEGTLTKPGLEVAPEAGWPELAVVQEASARAMQFFGTRYWDLFIEPFFYIEENWHCIAAAAALDVRRDPAYEQFCLDYVAFKGRFMLDDDDGVHPDFEGGWGFGNIVQPQNTPTAGFGEALAAAMHIKHRRGESTEVEERWMRGLLGFLLRHQWRSNLCYACFNPSQVHGAFSEHMASPKIRIDYVQHAWSALAHGSRVLGYDWAEALPVNTWPAPLASASAPEGDPQVKPPRRAPVPVKLPALTPTPTPTPAKTPDTPAPAGGGTP